MDRYFESYEELDIHKLMLDDRPRTLAYKNAIFNSRDIFQDKVVMDVGAGTGILSIFSAQAGAKVVYAIEASHLADIAKQVIIENNLENVIKVIHSKVEDLTTDSVEKVDVIVSEWMGFYLIHEGMLDSVLFARDTFLQENGTLFPSIAKLYAAPCQLPSMYEFWDNVFGIDMKYVGKKYREAKSNKPEILSINQLDILTESKLLAWIDIRCISRDEINQFGNEEYITVCNKDGKFQGICIWFAVEFPDNSELSTSPYNEPTHWKQTVIVLPEEIYVAKGEPIAFKLQFKRNSEKQRQYNMELGILNASEIEHDMPCSCYLTKCIVTRTYIEEHGRTVLFSD